MADYNDELSRQYHSFLLYYGSYTYSNVTYRIGNDSKTVKNEKEKYYDTWINFHLIPTARPTVPVPKGSTKLVTIPGRRFPIDMTNYLTGHVIYQNRTGSWSFFTDNDYVKSQGGFETFDKYLRGLIHGRIFKVVLRDDPEYFYVGKLSVGQWKTGSDRSTVTISYNLYPYKKSLTSTLDMWKFDDFNFKEGIVQYINEVEVVALKTIRVIGSQERVTPHVSGKGGTLVIKKKENGSFVNYGNVPTSDISSNDSIIPGLTIDEGINELQITGNGYITIDYRRGLL